MDFSPHLNTTKKEEIVKAHEVNHLLTKDLSMGFGSPSAPDRVWAFQSCHTRWHLCCIHKIIFPKQNSSISETISILSKANKPALRILNSMQNHLSKVHKGLEALGSATDASGLFRGI